MPTVSVIIPCFNQGQYLSDAINSVLAQNFQDLEIIIVDDGSTAQDTLQVFANFQYAKSRVIRSKNQGLPAARNLAISHAKGRYILPLDCDDKIAPSYLEKAVSLLDADPALGIVYCRAEFFGIQSGLWRLEKYCFPEFLFEPSIFCSAVFRREDWEATGGYSSELLHGYEDHDFWLGLIKRGRKVRQLDEVLFSYRRTAQSMSQSITLEQKIASFMVMFHHHRELFINNIEVVIRGFLTREALEQVHAARPVLQLFADTGSGYNESDSSRIEYVADEWTTVMIPLPGTNRHKFTPLRLDPGMKIGCYDLSEVELVKLGSPVSSLRFENSDACASAVVGGTALPLPAHGFLRIFSFGTDPHVILEGLAPDTDADSARVRIRYQSTLSSATDSIVRIARPLLQVFEDMGAGYNETDSVRIGYPAGDWVTVTLPLPRMSGSVPSPLRLDPGIQPGCYDLIEVELLCKEQPVSALRFDKASAIDGVEVTGTAIRLPATGFIRIFSYGKDPQLRLNSLTVVPGADAMRVRLRYQSSIAAAADSFSILAAKGQG